MEDVLVPQKESKWYVLRVVSGKERKVKEYLDKDIQNVIEISHSEILFF